MQVTVEHLGPCTLGLSVEVGADKVGETIKSVYRELSKQVDIPGFRRGKAPQAILERYVPAESVRTRAIERLVGPAYLEALKEADAEPFAEPELEIVQFEANQPFIFKAKVPLPPKIELGEYKGIEVNRPTVKVTDEDVESHLKKIQESRAKYEVVHDRGIAAGDFVTAEITSQLEGDAKDGPRRTILHVGTNLPDFDAAIMGMRPGERRVFSIKYPQDFTDPQVAGKSAEFDVAIESIRVMCLPEINDDFAKELGHDSVDDLREDVRQHLLDQANKEADAEVERKIVEEIVSRSNVQFPEVMLDHEVRHDLEDIEAQLRQRNLTMEQYLSEIGETEEQFIEGLKQAASRRLRNGLVLGEIATREGIEVTDEEVQAEIERIAEERNASVEAVTGYYDARGGRGILANRLLNRKLFDFLKSVSNIRSGEEGAEST